MRADLKVESIRALLFVMAIGEQVVEVECVSDEYSQSSCNVVIFAASIRRVDDASVLVKMQTARYFEDVPTIECRIESDMPQIRSLAMSV